MTAQFVGLAAALLLSTAPGLAASESPSAAELARALQGRVAGDPVDCLQLHEIRSTRIIPDTGILYETTGGTIYLNRPRTGQNFLHRWDVLVTDTSLSRLCSVDIVRLYSTSPWMQTGTIGLGEFVPYTKTKD